MITLGEFVMIHNFKAERLNISEIARRLDSFKTQRYRAKLLRLSFVQKLGNFKR